MREQLFNQAVQLTKKTSPDFDLYAQGPALRDVIIQIVSAGQTERALQLTKTLSSHFLKAQALNEIAASLANQGQLPQAKQVLLEALQFARGITGDYAYESNGSCGNDKFKVLSKIAVNLSLLSQLNTTLQVASSVSGCSSASGESNQDYQAEAFLGILAHLAKVDQVKQTSSSAQGIKNSTEKASAQSASALKLIDLGEPPLALWIAKKLASEKAKILADIAHKYAHSRQQSRALLFAETIADNELKVKTIAAFATLIAQ